MNKMKLSKKNKSAKNGSSMLEYAMVIFCIVTALAAMTNYIQRGLQGKLKTAADTLGEQYEPGKTNSGHVVVVNSKIVTDVTTKEDSETGKNFTETKTTYDKDNQTTTGWEWINQ